MTAATTRIYRRLPGRSLDPLTAATLYAAPDHLLLVSNPGYLHEQYVRFYFRDIQALLVQKTRRRAVVNLVAGLPASLCLLGILSISSPALIGVLTVAATLMLLVVAINTLRGATSVCRVVTAHTDRVLPSLGRLRTAERTTVLLEPLIRDAQQGLAEEAAGAPAVVSPPMAFRSVPPPREVSPLLHYLSTGLLAAHALMSLVAFFMYGELHSLVHGLVITALFPMVLLALVRQRDSQLPSSMQRWTWAAFWYLFVGYFAHYAYSFTGYFRYAGDPGGQWGIMRRMMAEGPYDSPYLYALYLADLVISTALLVASVPMFFGNRGRMDAAPLPEYPSDTEFEEPAPELPS